MSVWERWNCCAAGWNPWPVPQQSWVSIEEPSPSTSIFSYRIENCTFSEDAKATASFQAAHRNTAVEKVLSIMPHPEQITVKAGFFPDSLDGLEEFFCLVSLDVDFYQTTLEGLRYFWPRLQQGGYLLLHDWGNPSLPGVKQAFEGYQQEIGAKIPAIPLCDVGGSLILCK